MRVSLIVNRFYYDILDNKVDISLDNPAGDKDDLRENVHQEMECRDRHGDDQIVTHRLAAWPQSGRFTVLVPMAEAAGHLLWPNPRSCPNTRVMIVILF